jgi:uncharacterized protein YmfQ (DUF2313 family)
VPFFRIIQHLLPRSRAWTLIVDRTLRKFFVGLANGVPAGARAYIDNVWEQISPETTDEIAEWEQAFGITANSADTEAVRQARLAARWQATGGQGLDYIQSVLQAAGFDVYLHECWSAGCGYPSEAWVCRDPRNYTDDPHIGTTRCSAFTDNQPRCRPREWDNGDPASQWRCNRWLANNPRYLVNIDLTRRAPPPVPEDDAYWPYFLYVGPEVLLEKSEADPLVHIPNTRRVEFERLLMQLCPTQHWIVIMVDYVGEGVFDYTFSPAFE